MSYKPLDSKVKIPTLEHEVQTFWKDTNAYWKRVKIQEAEDRPHWSFIDGPITANNPMGVHHAWGRTFKDIFQRYKAMCGFDQRWQNGFDCQGLWVEVNVERDMGFKTKKDIEAFGLADFVNLCKQRVLEYAAVQTQQSIRLGYWMDWNDPAVLREDHQRVGLPQYQQGSAFQDAQFTQPGRAGQVRRDMLHNHALATAALAQRPVAVGAPAGMAAPAPPALALHRVVVSHSVPPERVAGAAKRRHK